MADHPRWVIAYKPDPGERKHWWGTNNAGAGGWSPYPGNAHHYDSENSALHVMHSRPSLKRSARGEVLVERRPPLPTT